MAGLASASVFDPSPLLAQSSPSAGFKLVAEGKFLRRPGDDHTLSIFDDKIRGKTDQYALKFVKPR